MSGVPSSLMSAGYDKTITEVREKMEARITNQTNRLQASPAYHRGRAHPASLPDEALGIWLDWDEVVENKQDMPFNAQVFVSTWLIQIVVRDEGSDSFGTQSDLGTRIWGDILRTFTETLDDLGLNGTIDYLTTRSHHYRGTVRGTRQAAGDRRIEWFEIEAQAHHQMEIVRQPP